MQQKHLRYTYIQLKYNWMLSTYIKILSNLGWSCMVLMILQYSIFHDLEVPTYLQYPTMIAWHKPTYIQRYPKYTRKNDVKCMDMGGRCQHAPTQSQWAFASCSDSLFAFFFDSCHVCNKTQQLWYKSVVVNSDDDTSMMYLTSEEWYEMMWIYTNIIN